MEPLERIDRTRIEPPKSKDPNLFDRLLALFLSLKDTLLSCVKPLSDRGRYVKVADSATDQKVQSVAGKLKKQQFKENLIEVRTFSPKSEELLGKEIPPVRRKNEEQSRIRKTGKKEPIEVSPLKETEFLIRVFSHASLSGVEIKKLFKDKNNGSYLINKTDAGLELIVKRNNVLERFSLVQLKDEEDMPKNEILSNGMMYASFSAFLNEIGVNKKDGIERVSQLYYLKSEAFLHEISYEEGVKLLQDRPDRSFIVLRSDNPEYRYFVLIKKEPLLPVFEAGYEKIYYKLDGDEQVISDKGKVYPDLDTFLFENGTTIGRGQIN